MYTACTIPCVSGRWPEEEEGRRRRPWDTQHTIPRGTHTHTEQKQQKQHTYLLFRVGGGRGDIPPPYTHSPSACTSCPGQLGLQQQGELLLLLLSLFLFLSARACEGTKKEWASVT